MRSRKNGATETTYVAASFTLPSAAVVLPSYVAASFTLPSAAVVQHSLSSTSRVPGVSCAD